MLQRSDSSLRYEHALTKILSGKIGQNLHYVSDSQPQTQHQEFLQQEFGGSSGSRL